MSTRIGNLFADLDPIADGERFDQLLALPGGRLERIVSTGHATPAGEWFDQAQDEWVLLLSGSASLRFADETEARAMKAGDWLLIAAGRRHRVDATSTSGPTVWLALHYQGLVV